MSISSVGTNASYYTSALQQRSNSAPAKFAGRDSENDGDKDDGAKAARAPQSGVNSSGQQVGSQINITA
ncbi:MAG: hypothetical protein RIR18_479 [Pseudomonadota bacterium]